MQNFGSCLEKAGELCGARGYVVVNQQGDAAPFSAATGGYSASALAASGGGHCSCDASSLIRNRQGDRRVRLCCFSTAFV